MKLLNWAARRKDMTAQPATGSDNDVVKMAASPQGVTLQDLVLLKVAISWQEAISLLLETLGTSGATFPDPSQVTVSEIGEVRVNGTRATPGHPTSAAATYLKNLLGSATTPAELKAIIEQDAVPQPRHATLEEFAAALAYFERPGRRGDVAAVYTRAHALYTEALADLELERLRAKAVSEQTATLNARSTHPWQQRALQIGLVVVLAVVILSGVLTLFSLAFAPAPATDDAGAPVETRTPTAALVAAGREAKRLATAAISLAASSALPAANSRDGQAASPAARTARAARGGRADGSVPSATAGHDSGAAAAASVTSPEPAVEWSVSVRDVTASAPDGGVILDEQEVEDAASLPVFSTTNAEVTPAMLVRPQLPTRVTQAAPGPTASVLDLVVDAKGRVERVILESAHGQVNEKMLVSAAKAWVFEPALRDGKPVRYRLRVQISEQ